MEALTLAESVRIDVAGGRAATAVATWGQRAIWHCLEFAPEAEAQFNLSRIVDVPEGPDTQALVRAIAELVRVHDTLRTVFQSAGGRLLQVVQASGTLTLARYEVTDRLEEAARTVSSELASQPFRRNEWPVRFALVTDGTRRCRMVLICSHLAVDQEGLRQLIEDLRETMLGRPIAPRSRQPLEQAAYEQSPHGRAVSERALKHWSRNLEKGPASLFDYPRRTVGAPRFRRLVMSSEAITQAVELAASRMRVSSASVLLAATATALAEFTGHRAVPLQTICSNRDNAAWRDMVGTLSWDGVITVATDESSFRQITRRTFQASLATYGNGYYDPEAAWRLRKRHEHLCGAIHDLSAHFNDIRNRAGRAAELEDPGPTALGRLMEATTTTEAACPDQSDARFYLTVRSAHESTLLSLICDTLHFSIEDMSQALHAIERVVTTAAHDDLAGPLLGSALRITPVGREGWTPCGDGWVDLAAAQRLWQEVTGDATARLFPEKGTSCSAGLVAYLAGTAGRSVAALHRAFMAALGGRTDVRAPTRYVVCARAPHELDAPAAWAQAPVVAEGSGRDQEVGHPEEHCLPC